MNQSVVEKLLSIIKLVAIYFQKANNAAFLVRFPAVCFELTHLSLEKFLVCMVLVEMPVI